MTRRRAFGVAVAALVAGGPIVAAAASSGAAGLPAPKFGQTVDIGLVKGVVTVRPTHGVAFRLGPIDQSIPVGSVIDTSKGEVDLRTAYAPTSGRRGVQDGQFGRGAFTIRQPSSGGGLSELDLSLPSRVASRCAARLSSRTLTLLRASAHGRFRTRGRYAAATVRGTAWTAVDRCDGTLVQVQRGVVSVRDLVRHVTVSVGAGHRYLARAP